MFKDGKESCRAASDFMFDGSDAVEIRHHPLLTEVSLLIIPEKPLPICSKQWPLVGFPSRPFRDVSALTR
jgi:hypothetical protein